MKNISTLKKAIIIIYVFVFIFFSLVARSMLYVCLPNEYTLIKNIKIDSISTNMKKHGTSFILTFKDGNKTDYVTLADDTEMNIRTFRAIMTYGRGTIDLVRMENCKILGKCPEEYLLYDERFLCDSNNQCNYKDEHVKKYIFLLLITLFIFFMISYGFYKLFNSRFVNENPKSDIQK
ncbi:hypothetical protein [Flavobacterium salmonis]|uniref:Uncharacterized protein n=1 Tax=Flavobacterium salmonis TaxID=2654844 RepID=A0A6V6Z7U3_9FLAO|nr:hypothetical protein [Flavobacterium salmonis]CAD0007873.1 hypothetical protein FLAT13_04091 [Flavobacterium salmonis]